MEDYDTFVQLCLRQLRENNEEEHSKLLSPSSVIGFGGRPILPPLLSGKQREEMQRHRDEAQKAATRRMKGDLRMDLHSVQLRKTQTLEKFLQETEISTSRTSYGEGSAGTVDSPSPASVNKLNNGGFVPSKTSTSYSAVLPQRHRHDGCLSDQSDSHQESRPCSCDGEHHHSSRSGCVTPENTENVTWISGRIDSESQNLSSSEEINNMSGFYLHNSSKTAVQLPDIISYPPIDGEELERSGLESVLLSHLLGGTYVCEKSEAEASDLSRQSCSVEHEGDVPVTTKHHPFNNTDTNEQVAAFREKTCLLDHPDPSHTVNNPPFPTPELRKAPSHAEPVDNQINITHTNPHPMSLQALLKRSQEYRRRQRMLRNQTRSAKMQESTKEQPKAGSEEQSLSDKENDEGTVTAGGRTIKEKRDTFNNVEDSDVTGEKANLKPEDGNNKELMSADEQMSFRNKLNSPQEFITESKQSHVLVQQLLASAETSHVQDTSSGTKRLEDILKNGRNYVTVPVPSFCRSPTPCISKGSPKQGLTVDEAKTLVRCSALNQLQIQNIRPKHQSLVAEDDVTSVFTKTSQQIDQLEADLSSLKDLILDLESTVKDQDQTELSESCWKVPRCSKFNHQHVQQRDEDDDESQKLQSNPFINFRNTCKDLDPVLSFAGGGAALFPVQENEPGVVEINRQRLQTTAAGQEAAESDAEQAASSKNLLTAKCPLSVAQQRLIPTKIQNVPNQTVLSCDTSALTDQRNRPESREGAPEGQSSVHSPSLNHSYDVETPSGLWLLEGSGSDAGPQNHLGQEKNLTPESEAEEQGRVSKVKRRLHMRATDGPKETNVDPGGAAGPVVRPISSTLTAAMRRNDSLPEDEREQLQQVVALQGEHRKQQEELLQALAERYRLLQSVSPRSVPGSRPEDALTFSTFSQPLSPLPQRCRPLLAAAIKGFLTRRLLRTERVSQLVRTIRDTQQFLQAFRQQDASRGEFFSRQDVLLQKRVALQLRAAHYEVYDIFFSLSAGERMQLISWDRELVRERQLKQQKEHAGFPRRMGFLSAATQKSLERKRETMIQKRALERHRGDTTKTGQKSTFTVERPQETKRGQFKANPQRLPTSAYSSRPR
nr:uncharacterized protein si:ch73-100l22.3 isoform X2 [Nothobranchius furzeri]